MEVTFETLPKAVSQLCEDIAIIKQHLLQLRNQQEQPTEQWFNLTELCNYLPEKPAKPTVYSWVSNSLIPHHKKRKKLSFLKSEIDNWLKEGRRQTLSEIEAAAQNLVCKKKKG